LREIDSKLNTHFAPESTEGRVRSDESQTGDFGCWVIYEEDSGETRCYQMVGPDEIMLVTVDQPDWPVGQARIRKLMMKSLFSKPGGLKLYITDIS
jgi:hypothetical protein